MEAIFLKLLNMSINAGWLILAIIALRFLLRKFHAPAWISCLLWTLAAVRLLCPISLESIFSLIPSRETIPREIALSPAPSVNSGVDFVDNMVNPVLHNSFTPAPGASANPLQIWLFLAGILWAVGTGFLLLYALFGCIRLYGRVRTAVRYENRIYISEFIDIPFIFGLLRPRIYLPSKLPGEVYGPVLAHEQAHLDRLDYLWKILGYLLLAVYWFHPLCWAAYVLLCRDLELACDEKVIKSYDAHEKKIYSEALLVCSLKTHRFDSICPLAFGEVGVKERIRSVLHYKKPALWVISAAILSCMAAAVCFLTDPADSPDPSGEKGSASFDNSDNPDVQNTMPGSGDERQHPGDFESGSSGQSPGNSANNGTGQNPGSAANNGSVQNPGGQPDSNQPASAALVSSTTPELLVSQWANAFVTRNGNHIAALASDEVISDLKERDLLSGSPNHRSFGESSPWPVDPQTDAVICTLDSGRAEINYYAWTSEPHVTVWRETLFYEPQNGEYFVTDEELLYLDDISSIETFSMAYGNPPAIDGSSISYLNNGAWESLNQTALLSSNSAYLPLFEPESAAIKLLNLSDDPSKVKVERMLPEESDPVGLQIRFADAQDPIQISMSRPGSDPGIWIPLSYRISPLYRFSRLDWDELRRRNLPVTEDPDWTDILCLGRFPEEDIAIYGYNDKDCFGQGIAIDVGGNVNYFDWSYTSPQTILPWFYWNDKARQLQAALHIYTGTGAASQELHILQLSDTGVLQDNVLDFNGRTDLLRDRILYAYDKESGILTLSDKDGQKELAKVTVEDAETILPELGSISFFTLGETISLRIDTGYFPDDAHIAEYEGMPVLKAEITLEERGGYIRFGIGAITVADDSQPH